MMKSLLIITVFVFTIFLTMGVNSVYAQKTFVINIPSGAADINAPFFWQSEEDGDTTGSIKITLNDSVRWDNADSAAHTVTSGTVDDGPDGIFDSSLFGPGKNFEYQFTELGEFPYFCIVHPWMTGEITVTIGYSILPKVGADAGDGKTTFDVQYQFNRVVSDAKVDQTQNAISFTIVGKAKTQNNELTLLIPKALISGPYVIWADGVQVEFEKTDNGGINKLVIPLTDKTEQVTIVGTSVVPEFGTLAIIILAIAVVSIVAFTSKSKLLLRI